MRSSVSEALLNALKDGPLPPAALKAKARCEKHAMYSALKELVAANKVHKTGKTRDAIWILGPSKGNGHGKGPWRATA